MQLQRREVESPRVAHFEDVARDLVDGRVKEKGFVIADRDALGALMQVDGTAHVLESEGFLFRVSALKARAIILEVIVPREVHVEGEQFVDQSLRARTIAP